MEQIRVVLADDHPLVLRGIRDFLTAVGGIEVVEACRHGAEAVQAIRQFRPEIAVLDVSMPVMDGFKVLQTITAEGLATKMIFLTAAPRMDELVGAMAGGAFGFLSKDCQPDELAAAIRRGSAGQRTFQLGTISHVGRSDKPLHELLTQAELKVLELAVMGLTNKQISQELNISPGTIKTHLHHGFQKTGTKNRTALAALSRRATLE